MELRRLSLLQELAQLGTIAAVAQARSYSPSSVSVQLAELEREAGTALLRRVGRNVELTAAGHRLASYAERALAADEAVRVEIATLADTVRGRVRISFPQTPAIFLLPGLLTLLAETAPELEVQIVQSETVPALDQVRARNLDLVVGIEYDPVPVARHRDLDRQDLLREDVLVALPPDHPSLTRAGTISLSGLADSVWATGQPGTGLDAVLRNVCNRLAGYDPLIGHRTDDALIIGSLVAAGGSVALLPSMIAKTLPGISTRRIRQGRLQRSLFTAARTGGAAAPAILAVRAALRRTARTVATADRDLVLRRG